VGVHLELPTLDGITDERQISTMIDVVAEDVLPVGTPVHQMVPRTLEVDSLCSSHLRHCDHSV
jgi:hypothetical protein